MEKTVVEPIRGVAQIRNAEPQTAETRLNQDFFWRTVTSPPELPGLSRPVWLTIAASVPTALLWYGWYKFSVEEELFYDELRREGRTTGAGGFGTLILFSWLVLLGGLGSIAGIPHADYLIDAGAAWILLGQVNLYKRVNELVSELAPEGESSEEEPPLYAWWALLPPPLDVVVGLRQVHFLAKYWAKVRGDEWQPDPVAEELFPFISAPRFTLKTFARTPSLWFWFTKNVADLDFEFLQEPGSGGKQGLPPPAVLGVASSGMGLLKPLFAAEARLQAGVLGGDLAEASKAIDSELAQSSEASAPSPLVVIYTYALSPFSTEAIALLDRERVPYKKIELGLEWFLLGPLNSAIRAELSERTGQSSLPHVFVRGESVGGLYSGTPGLANLQVSGKLRELAEAGGIP